MIMRVPFEDIQRGLSEEQLRTLKKTGVMIVTGGVQQEVKVPFQQGTPAQLKGYS